MDRRSVQFRALVEGLQIFSSDPLGPSLLIFLLDHSLLSSITNLCTKSPLLTLAFSFTALLFTFLDTDPSCSAELWLFKRSWSQVPGKNTLQEVLATLQPHLVTDPPVPRKLLTFHLWHMAILSGEVTRSPGHHAWVACLPTLSPDPPPFVQGILSHSNRPLFTNGLQLLARHSFITNYSDCFWPDAGDNTCCPCNYADVYSPPPSLGPTRRTTLSHILFDCPLLQEHRQSSITHHSIHSLFSTEDGGHHLAQFIFNSQTTLCSLSLRPDPP
jgi:hypothetical protein